MKVHSKQTDEPPVEYLNHDYGDGYNDGYISSMSLHIKPSRFLFILVFFGHCCAISAVFMAGISAIIQYGIVAILLLLLGCYTYQWSLSPCYRLQYCQGHWRLLNPLNPDDNLTIIACYYWSPCLVVYRVKNVYLYKAYFPVFFDSSLKKDFHLIKKRLNFSL